jgi:hypothetical protein
MANVSVIIDPENFNCFNFEQDYCILCGGIHDFFRYICAIDNRFFHLCNGCLDGHFFCLKQKVYDWYVLKYKPSQSSDSDHMKKRSRVDSIDKSIGPSPSRNFRRTETKREHHKCDSQ